jgi:hypothetical protein
VYTFDVVFSGAGLKLFVPLYAAGNLPCHCKTMFAWPEIQ